MNQLPDMIGGFSHTEYLIVFNAIIFGYVGAEYFQGWGSMIKNRSNIRPYWQHTAWTVFAFVMFIQNWWGIWPRTKLIDHSIFYFLYSLVPTIMFYLISAILFPDFKKDRATDMKTYFYRNTKWLFGLFAIYFVIAIINSFVYPDAGNVIIQNILRISGIVLSVSAAYYYKNTKLHIAVLIFGYLGLISFFMALPT